MPNKVYTSEEASILFIDPTVASGGQYVSFTPADLPPGSGWVSDPRDLGPRPAATLFRWRAKTKVGGAVTPINSIGIYWMGFDDPAELSAATGTLFGPDANFSSGNQLIDDPNRKFNLQWIGAISIDRADSGVPYTTSGLCNLFGRYGSVVFWNETLAPLSTSADATAFSLTPVPDEIM